MAATLISFQKVPTFGFAHHLYTETTQQLQNDIQHSFVMVYVKSGHLTVQIYERKVEAPAGSVLLLFRHVPFVLQSTYGEPQDYCSIQVYTDYAFRLLEDDEDIPESFSGLALPIVIPPGSDADSLKKDMYAIISNLTVSRNMYSLSAAMTMCGMLYRMDAVYRQKQHRGKNCTIYWEYKIKRYLADHIREPVSLEQLAAELRRTPNYLNNVFSQATGIGIHQYMNREKMRLAATLMEARGLPFGEACDNVGIHDLSHGYRLFKKHIGITPKEYMSAERMTNTMRYSQK